MESRPCRRRRKLEPSHRPAGLGRAGARESRPEETESALEATEPRGPHGARLRTPRAQARSTACDCYPSDPETGVASGLTRGRNMRSRYRCSMCPAIHINSRSWLRSSSTHEPSDPPLRAVSIDSEASAGATTGELPGRAQGPLPKANC